MFSFSTRCRLPVHGGEFRAKGPFDISLGHRPGKAPGIVTPPNLSRAPTARFIPFGKYLLGGAMSRSGDLARAFSPHGVFRFVTWGFAPGWFEDAPLALTEEIGATPAAKTQDSYPLLITLLSRCPGASRKRVIKRVSPHF